jgi:hypothetical protein
LTYAAGAAAVAKASRKETLTPEHFKVSAYIGGQTKRIKLQ